MSNYTLSSMSLRLLAGVHSDLVRVAILALQYSDVDFGITEGVRSQDRQKWLFAQGKTKTLNSKHLRGEAFDIVCYNEDGKVTWDRKYYRRVSEYMYRAAEELGVTIKWGGDFKTFFDGPHFELI